MSKLTVVKPFVFSTPGVERSFRAGEHEIDAATAEHPFIKSGADGHLDLEKVAERVDEKPEPKERKGR
jgi:hypothetical protein